jgi:hypothetical protein
MSRQVYLLGVGVALAGLALAFTDWALSLPPGVTEANVKRLRPGMTQAEVEALLGEAPTSGGVLVEDGDLIIDQRRHPRIWIWQGKAGSAFVTVDVTGRVQIAWWERRDRQSGPLDRFRSWLDW